MAPDAKIISPETDASNNSYPRQNLTPVTFLPSNCILLTCAFVITVKLARDFIG